MDASIHRDWRRGTGRSGREAAVTEGCSPPLTPRLFFCCCEGLFCSERWQRETQQARLQRSRLPHSVCALLPLLMPWEPLWCGLSRAPLVVSVQRASSACASCLLTPRRRLIMCLWSQTRCFMRLCCLFICQSCQRARRRLGCPEDRGRRGVAAACVQAAPELVTLRLCVVSFDCPACSSCRLAIMMPHSTSAGSRTGVCLSLSCHQVLLPHCVLSCL